jgi:hypothetical protein
MTSAQRARLVVALGVLNLVLATFALTVGIGVPRPSPDQIANVPSVPPVTLPTPLPSASTQPVATPAPSGPTEPATPAPQPTAVSPSVGPASPAPGGVVIVIRPTSVPIARPTAAPTPVPVITPAPVVTPRPTPAPTSPPKLAAKPANIPPCPDTVDGPPGHHKGDPADRPCGKGNGGNGAGQTKGGVVIIVPFAIAAGLATLRGRLLRPLHPRRREA